MSKEPIKAGKTVDEEKKEAEVYYDFGENIHEMVDKFGEDQVYAMAKREGTRKLQSAIRRELKAGTDPEAIPDRLASWSPNVKHKVQKDPEEAAEEAFSAMSPEAQEKYLEKIRKKIQG